jgi:hypothetical protein
MALSPTSGVLRGFPAATHVEYAFLSRFAGAETLVRPCSTKKLPISELETHPCPIFIHEWARFIKTSVISGLEHFATGISIIRANVTNSNISY